ncbi:MAG: hypothetical protein ACTHPO_12140 [Alphaproteobacteria bacterium]
MDQEQDRQNRFLAGMNSFQRSILDPVKAAGYDLTHPKQAEPQDWEGLFDLLTCFSRGQKWPIYTTPLFAICAAIYCFLNSYSILASVLVVCISAFVGYAAIGFAVVIGALAILGLLVYLFVLVFGLFM